MTERDRPAGLRRVLADVAGFAGSQYFLRFTGILKSFVVARMLGPAGNGLWQHFVIISEYCQYSHFGALQGLNKVLGHRVGRGDEEGADAAQRTGQGSVFLGSVVLWIALLAYTVLRWNQLEPWDRWGLPLVGLVVVSQQVTFVYQTLLRAYSRIHLISITETAFGLTNLVVSIALLLKLGVFGLLLGWLITRAATMLWMIARSGYAFRPAVSLDQLRALLVTGFPIYLFHLTRVGLRNIDRVLVDAVLDKSQLGIYALAGTLAGLIRYAADAVGFVIYPILLRSYGETGDPRACRAHLEKPTELLSLIVPIALGFAYLVLHLPVLAWLPEFVPTIAIFRLLTVSMAFQCLAVLPGFYLMAIDRQNALVPMGVVAIAFEFTVGRMTIDAGMGLPGVAVTMGVGSLLYSTAVLAYAGTFAIGSSARTALWVARVYAPILFFAGVVAAIRWIVPHTALAGAGEVLRSSVEGTAFLLIALPVLLFFERRHGVLRRLMDRTGAPGA